MRSRPSEHTFATIRFVRHSTPTTTPRAARPLTMLPSVEHPATVSRSRPFDTASPSRPDRGNIANHWDRPLPPAPHTPLVTLAVGLAQRNIHYQTRERRRSDVRGRYLAAEF